MAQSSTFMLFLDACRNNPFADAAWAKQQRGLSAPVSASASTGSPNEWVLPRNVAVSHSTQPGMVASDGPPDKNSYYAMAFASILAGNPSVPSQKLLAV